MRITLANVVFREEGGSTPPLGVLSLVAFLEKKGFEADVIDYQLNEYKNQHNPKQIYKFLLASSDVLGISTFSNALPYIIPALEMIKQEDPEKIVVLGGSGVSQIAPQLIGRFKQIDYIISGEGENSFTNLLQNLKRGKRNPTGGTIGRINGKIAVGKDPPPLLHIDSLPLPAIHKISLKKYNHFNLVTMRGCPYTCSFCYAGNHWTKNVRYMSVKRMFDHIDLLLDATDTIRFADDLFPGNRKRFLDFCDEYKKRGCDFKWTFSTRVNTLGEDMMRAASKCGAFRLFIGVESASNNVLAEIHKQYPTSIIRKQLLTMRQYFDDMHISMIYGFPFETIDDFEQTIDLAKWVVANDMEYRLHKICPLPGTPMTTKYKSDIIYSNDFSDNVEDVGITKPIQKLIMENKDIFSAYFSFKTPELSTKMELIEEFENTPIAELEEKYREKPILATK